MIDNEHVWSGYRIGFNTKRKIVRSLFMVHNESVNVWTHLIGAICFIGLILYTFTYLAPPGLDDLSDQPIFRDHQHGWF